MKFTLGWLRDYLDTEASLDDIVEGLMGCGFEVESTVDMAQRLAPFSVARVLEARPHPNADRLKVCDVETAWGVMQVVCGAPNARTGLLGIFAPVGTHIPGTGIDLVEAEIRGVESNGMLLSERELLISDDHEGIIDIEGGYTVGTPAARALGLDDPMIEIAVTPNRPDGLGVYGIARDLAAKGLGNLKPLQAATIAGTYMSPIGVGLGFEDGDASPCPLFIGRHFRRLKNGPSPEWLQRRLKAIGLRPISALVDITNYITYTFARPLHVFDADRINGTLHARAARDGEEILALDDKIYRLEAGMTVIADDNGPQGIAGIIGGAASGCTEETSNVMLEAAYFDPVRTAATGRQLNIQSDARYRFERGVDPNFVETGLEIATAMILDICGGETSRPVFAGEVPETARGYRLRKDRVYSLAGLDVPVEDQIAVLAKLGFGVTESVDGLECRVPSWRPDIHGEADLVEEICRIVGLDAVPSVELPRLASVATCVLDTLQRRQIATRRKLAGRGLNEAVTWSFVSAREAALFGGGRSELTLVNPISSELTDMRPSVLPPLVNAVRRNIARGFSDFGLFEVGPAYAGTRPADEAVCAAGVRTGNTSKRHWSGGVRAIDVFDAKADALAVLAACDAPTGAIQVVQGGPDWFHPGRCGTLQLGPKNLLAFFGEVHPRVLDELDIQTTVVAFEVFLNAIPEARAKETARPAMQQSDLMALTRDFAFVVDDGVPADRLVRAARGADRQLIADVTVFDLFQGAKAEAALGPGKKSLAIEVTLQPREKTLSEQDIDAVSGRIVSEVEKATGGQLRRQS